MVENDIDGTDGSLADLRLTRDGELEGELKEISGLRSISTESGGNVTEDDRKSLQSGHGNGVRDGLYKSRF